jgi:hypothetical protein
MNGVVRLTSTDLWLGAAITAAVVCGLIGLAMRLVSSEAFCELKWYLVGAGSLTYGLLWAVLGSVYFWDPVYRAVFPEWSRWVLPFFFGFLDGLAALGFWWLSMRVARWRVAVFILLAGPWSVLGHGIAMLKGLLNVPYLEQATAFSALTFATFEYMLYECAIVGMAVGARAASSTLGFAGRRRTRG